MAELFVSQLVRARVRVSLDTFLGWERHYGPGLQIGYQYVSPAGVTFLASAGGGVPLGVPDAVRISDVQVMFSLGVGYSWR